MSFLSYFHAALYKAGLMRIFNYITKVQPFDLKTITQFFKLVTLFTHFIVELFHIQAQCYFARYAHHIFNIQPQTTCNFLSSSYKHH